MYQLGIIVPCFNEQAVLAESIQRLLKKLDRLLQEGRIEAKSNLYLIDDGSTDTTWHLIKCAAAEHPRIQGIRLSRNFGHQYALLAGLLTAEGDALITIDADLQDDVETITAMVAAWHDGNDVVYGVRDDRSSDTVFKRLSAEVYYRMLAALGVNTVFNHADYRLLSRRAIETLRSFTESSLFLRGLIPLLGFPSAKVYYRRQDRLAGESKYPLRRMLSLALDGITSFSGVPLRLITVLGMVAFLVSGLLGAWALWVALATERAVPGWASTVVPMYFLGSVQLLGIGIIGEYLRKVYVEVKARPRFIIAERC